MMKQERGAEVHFSYPSICVQLINTTSGETEWIHLPVLRRIRCSQCCTTFQSSYPRQGSAGEVKNVIASTTGTVLATPTYPKQKAKKGANVTIDHKRGWSLSGECDFFKKVQNCGKFTLPRFSNKKNVSWACEQTPQKWETPLLYFLCLLQIFGKFALKHEVLEMCDVTKVTDTDTLPGYWSTPWAKCLFCTEKV